MTPERERAIDQPIKLCRCGTCGIWAPYDIGFGGKVVSGTCAHRDWREIVYVPAALPDPVRDAAREIVERYDAMFENIEYDAMTMVQVIERLRAALEESEEK